MLLSVALSSLLVIGTVSFYPQLQHKLLLLYQEYRLEQAVAQALSGLAKDIRRAGFIANKPENIRQKAIEISAQENCIIIRYDIDSTGEWRYNPKDPKTSDLFVYRYRKNNLEYQTGINNCKGGGWDKIFDPAEVIITAFSIKAVYHYIEIKLSAQLKNNTEININTIKIIKNENG